MQAQLSKAIARIDASDQSDLGHILRSILETILELPWLGTDAGGVFLADPVRHRLEMITHINLSPAIQNSCAIVNYGHCLCGRVAQSGRLLHVSCVDHRHEIGFDGMQDHGHYVVPLKWGERLLGILVLYVDVGHLQSEEEVAVLENFASIMALIIHSAQTQEEKRLSDLILSRSPLDILVTDQNLKIQWVNQAFEQHTGYRNHEVTGKTPGVLRSGKHGPEFYETMWRSIQDQDVWQGEIWNRRKNGLIHPQWLTIVALRNSQNQVTRYVGFYLDLTPIKVAEEKIHFLAYYDGLTGLGNAALLSERLADLLAQSSQHQVPVIVLTIALPYFQEINASLGRRVGDALLQETALRISGGVAGGVKARTGTSEFVVATLFDESKAETVEAFANQLISDVKAKLAPAFLFDQHELKLENKIGVAWGMGQTMDADTLLRRSAFALQNCSAQSPGGVEFYSRALEEKAAYLRALGLALEQAIPNNELYLVFQPQVNRQGKVIGAEVLLRWHSKEHGVVPPDIFIQIAEERGMIMEIGHWVFQETLSQINHWQEAGLRGDECGCRLAVNVSPHQILSESVVEEFTRACQDHEVDPCSIELEITESDMATYSDHVIDRLRALSESGFQIAIDDFGTGHSSLSRLRHFPINVLKIDRGFMTNITSDPSDAALVKSVIDMAHTLGYEVIAEGVEEASQLALLKEYGCDLFQGYYFSKPLMANEFADFLQASNTKHVIPNANLALGEPET